MKEYKNQTFDEERALYGSLGVRITDCRFDGPADGESALKEGKDIAVENSYFNLRYPFWHDTHVTITDSHLTENCRAALWYSRDIQISGTKLHGIKALRECADVTIKDSDIISQEFGWSVKGLTMINTSNESEYFMMRSENLHFDHVSLKGKYSFQYIEKYLAWYSENITFINCTIIGTQPLCYCKGLKLINCTMIDTDLAFERSEVEAELNAPIFSIKNPRSGSIRVPAAEEIIMDDPMAKGTVIVTEAGKTAEDTDQSVSF